MKPWLFSAALFMATTVTAGATDCKSVGGHLEGRPVTAVRHVKISGKSMFLSGTFNGVLSPRRKLNCAALHAGVYCEKAFGPVLVTVMTNGNRMTETVAALSNGAEQAGISYVCDTPMKM